MVKKIGIISLSSGVLGEDFLKHELEIGLKRLEAYGIETVLMPNALKGLDYIKANPGARAEDLLEAFKDDTIDMILVAIGGDDTYRLLPFLFENDELRSVVRQKIFLGFSDTTVNHFMLNKVGIKTFYGQAFLPDICELAEEMLPYTKQYFEELLSSGRIKKIVPSNLWYDQREDFSEAAMGTMMDSHSNNGFELLRGQPVFEGEILGGCIDTIYDIFDNSRYEDTVELCSKYNLFPTKEQWKNRILLLETSEEKPVPELYRKMIQKLKNHGIFDEITGLLIGKPQDESYFEEYKMILLEEIDDKQLPIVYNINVGHATPRCIIPFGVHARVDVSAQEILFDWD